MLLIYGVMDEPALGGVKYKGFEDSRGRGFEVLLKRTEPATNKAGKYRRGKTS
jgi:hypothetical protein